MGQTIFDSEGYPDSGAISVQRIGDFGESTSSTERRAFYEFNIGNLSLAPNIIISRAFFDIRLGPVYPVYRYLFLELFGYVGNGRADLSDFDAGVGIGLENALVATSDFEFPRDSIDFDVTQFVNARVSNRDDFAGFGIRIEDFYANYGTAALDYTPSLTIETTDVAESVPEPTTIFGSAIGLCLGGWLKRKKSNQQSKTKS